MVRDTWLSRLGNHVTNTFKTAVKKASKKSEKGAVVGVLAFEVANLMAKLVQLWHSLSDQEIARLRTEVITLPGVRKVVSNDDNFLLGLACAEKLDNLSVLAGAVARLGKKCKDPPLQGFEHVYEDLLSKNIDFRALVFSVKEMEGRIKKMEKYIEATTNLYQELEILADLEQTLRRLQSGDEGARLKDQSLHSVHQKVSWQRQETKYLREISLWNRTFDAVVGLLARTVFTIYGRISTSFGVCQLDLFNKNGGGEGHNFHLDSSFSRSLSVSASGPFHHHSSEKREIRFSSGPLERCPIEMNSGRRVGPVLNRIGSNKVWHDKDRHTFVGSLQNFVSENSSKLMTWGSSSPARQSMEFLNPGLNGSHRPWTSRRDSSNGEYPIAFPFNCNVNMNGGQSADGCHPVPTSGDVGQNTNKTHNNTRSFTGAKCRILDAPPYTLGGAALALHYANVIIVIEKLVRLPHLIGPDARDDLYQMLPTSLRMALRARLRSCAKTIAPTMYNAALAADWSDALDRILEWLSPLAHNMIRWQSERNFEQQHLVPRTNVLLLQTLYFANQSKTELAITELLVGLNYICRYEQEIRASALMECSNHDYDEYLEWQI